MANSPDQRADQVQLRIATIADADSISALVCELTRKFIVNEFSESAAGNLLSSMTPMAIRRYIHAGIRYWLAESEGQLVGVLGIMAHRHVYHLFVAEAYQRHGIARRLWQAGMRECLAEGNPGVFTVNSSRYAQPVYARLGFTEQAPPHDNNGIVTIPMKLELIRD